MIILLLICLLIPPVAAVILPILYVKDKNHRTAYSIMIGLVFSISAFAFIPIEGSTNDLVRYFSRINMMSNVSFKELFIFDENSDSMIIADILYFISNRLGSEHFLPAISMFVTYTIVSYITTDLGERLKVSRAKVFIVLLIILSILSFPSLISNVRNIMAFSISILAVYNDLVKKKRNIFTLSLYILPMFLHVSSIIIIILRLLVILYKRKGSTLTILLVMISSFSSRFLEFIVSLIPGNNNLISDFANKGLYYVSTNESDYINYLQSSAFAQIEKIYYVGVAVFFLLITFYQSKRRTKYRDEKDYIVDQEGYKDFNAFFVLLCIMVVASIPVELTTYARFSWATLIASPICLLQLRFMANLKSVQVIFSRVILLFFAGGGLLHQILQFYIMADVPQTISRMFTPALLLFN